MVEEYSAAQPALASGTRCVILAADPVPTPGDLLAGLSKRGVSTVAVAEPAAAMLELARQATGALVVVEPASQPWLNDLIEAVARYHPKTVRWGYRATGPSDRAQLQPLEHLNLNSNSSARPPVAAIPAEEDDGPTHYTMLNPQSPLGRVQSQMPRERVRSLVVKVQGPAEVGEPLISEEELAMLLGPVPEEQGGA